MPPGNADIQTALFTSALAITAGQAEADPTAAIAGAIDQIKRWVGRAVGAGPSGGEPLDLTVYLTDSRAWVTHLRPALQGLMGDLDFTLGEIVVRRLCGPSDSLAVSAHVALPPGEGRPLISRLDPLVEPYPRSAAVLSRGGRLLLAAGQVANLPDGSIDGAGSLACQTARAYGNVRDVLAASGATPATVLSETIWTVDLEGWLHDGREAREGFYGNDFPAASAVEISSLSSPDLLVEVEIIAVAP